MVEACVYLVIIVMVVLIDLLIKVFKELGWIMGLIFVVWLALILILG